MLEQTQTSTWQSKLKALGPGILMASAAVGGARTLFPLLKQAPSMAGL